MTPPVDLLLVASMAFGFGLLHGLGPDHLAAITTIISRSQLKEGQKSKGPLSSTSSAWISVQKAAHLGLTFGLGHMIILAFIGGLGLTLGWIIPAGFERGAEIFGGVLLILLAVWLGRESLQGRYHLHLHHHQKNGSHFHWHSHDGDNLAHEERSPFHAHEHQHPGLSEGWAGLKLGIISKGMKAPILIPQTLKNKDQRQNSFLLGGLFALSGIRSLILMVPVMVTGTVFGAIMVVLLFGVGIILSMSVYGFATARVFHRFGTTETLARRAAQLTAGICLVLGVGWIGLAW